MAVAVVLGAYLLASPAATSGDKARLRQWADATNLAEALEQAMNQDLMDFARQWARVAVLALAPVIVTTFICVPMAIERHPGEAPATKNAAQWHMT